MNQFNYHVLINKMKILRFPLSMLYGMNQVLINRMKTPLIINGLKVCPPHSQHYLNKL